MVGYDFVCNVVVLLKLGKYMSTTHSAFYSSCDCDFSNWYKGFNWRCWFFAKVSLTISMNHKTPQVYRETLGCPTLSSSQTDRSRLFILTLTVQCWHYFNLFIPFGVVTSPVALTSSFCVHACVCIYSFLCFLKAREVSSFLYFGSQIPSWGRKKLLSCVRSNRVS